MWNALFPACGDIQNIYVSTSRKWRFISPSLTFGKFLSPDMMVVLSLGHQTEQEKKSQHHRENNFTASARMCENSHRNLAIFMNLLCLYGLHIVLSPPL